MPSLKIFWDSVQNAATYNIYYKTTPGVTISNGTPIVGIQDVVYYHRNLFDGTTYFYIVVAVDAQGNLGEPSVEFSALTSTATVTVEPEDITLIAGAGEQYFATIHYSGGIDTDITGSVIWDTSNHSVATIEPDGYLTTLTFGTINVIATYGAIIGSTTLTVDRILVSIAITPSSSPSVDVGNTLQFTATGIYNDATMDDITNDVSWSSTVPANATIDGYGLATGVFHGTTDITASLGLINATPVTLTVVRILQSIAVTPTTPSVAYPSTQQFTATGTYNDTSTANITNTVSWTSGTLATATINGTGLATPVHSGTSLITATLGLISGNTILTITHALTSIDVTPHTATFHFAGVTQQYTAIGTYSDADTIDLTNLAMWLSSVPGVATIDGYGLATVVGSGATNITATYASVTSNNAVLSFPSWLAQTGPGISGDSMSALMGASDVNILAGGTNGGNPVIWRWDGINWKTSLRGPGSTFNANNPVQKIKVSLGDPGPVPVWYANNIRNIIRSNDDGITWTTTTDPVPGQFVNGFCVVDDTTLWAHCGNNSTNFMKRSTDSGVTWVIQFTFPDGNTTINDMFFNGNSIWAVGNYSGVGVVWHCANIFSAPTTWVQRSPWTTNSGSGGAPQSDIFSVWGTSDTDIYISGTLSFVSTPTKSAIVHSTDLFTTYTPQTFTPASVSSSKSIYGIDDGIYAAVFDSDTTYLVYGYKPGVSSPNTWLDAGAAHNTGGTGALAVWANYNTNRAIAIGGTDIQVNQLGPDLESIEISSICDGYIYFNGSQRQYTAIGTYVGGDTVDITNSATWSSTVTGVATINSSGLATTVTAGTSNISASFGLVTSNSITLTVSTWDAYTNLPTDMCGLKHWVKADFGVDEGDGDVDTWLDQSGNGTNWEKSSGDGSITLVSSAQNGLPVLRSAAAGAPNYFQQSPFLSGTQQAEVFIMMKSNAPGTNYAWGGFGSDLTNLSHYPFTGGTDVYESFGNTTRRGPFTVANSGNATRAYGIYNVSSGSGASTYIARLNGTVIGTATGAPGWDTKFRLFAGGFNTSFQFLGDIGEVIIFNYVLTANERQGIYDYLKAKWNTPDGV